jgi:hypothetical protein
MTLADSSFLGNGFGSSQIADIYFACIAHDTPVEAEQQRERKKRILRWSRHHEADDMAGDEGGMGSNLFVSTLYLMLASVFFCVYTLALSLPPDISTIHFPLCAHHGPSH